MITGVGRTTADIANLAQKINIPSQIANRVLPEKLTPQYNVNRFRNFVYSQPRATTLEGKIGSFIGENAPYFAIPTGGSANYGSKTFSSLARSTPKVMQKIPLMQAAKIAGRKELLANIGREAVQGAGFMGGLAIGQDKSPKEIAKDILIGAGFGAGARLGMAGAGAVVGKVADKVKLQQAINSIKNPELRLQVNKEIGLLQSKPAFAKLPINPKKPSQPIVGANKGIETKIPKELEPLAQEAKKYKSAEEFMEAQARYKDYRAIHEAVREGKLKVGDITTTRAYGGEVVEIVPPEYTGELNDIGHPIRYRIQTKSELVDIWKKANAAQSLPEPKIKIKEAEIKPKPVQPATNIPKELEPLAKEDLYNQATKGANKGIDALKNEARKYKSAEEFVKAQGTPVYHGTALVNAENIDKTGFSLKQQGYSGKPIGASNKGEYISLSKKQSVSELHAIGSTKNGKGGTVLPVFIDKNAKIFSTKDIPKDWVGKNPTLTLDVYATQDLTELI